MSTGLVTSAYENDLGAPSWVASPGSNKDETVTAAAKSHVAAVNPGNTFSALTWQQLQAACDACPAYTLLRKYLGQGYSDNKEDWDPHLHKFYPHRHGLTLEGSVILYHTRPIIPLKLQPKVLELLHHGHAGVPAMVQRAQETVFWPNMMSDLQDCCARCLTCMTNAPSNPPLPSSPPSMPLYPFESIVADFFSLNQRSYLAIADQFSNWLSVLCLKQDTTSALIEALRDYFATYGIPVTISSDGASIFTSYEFRDFCSRLGVTQRISSAYN